MQTCTRCGRQCRHLFQWTGRHNYCLGCLRCLGRPVTTYQYQRRYRQNASRLKNGMLLP